MLDIIRKKEELAEYIGKSFAKYSVKTFLRNFAVALKALRKPIIKLFLNLLIYIFYLIYNSFAMIFIK